MHIKATLVMLSGTKDQNNIIIVLLHSHPYNYKYFINELGSKVLNFYIEYDCILCKLNFICLII